MCMNTFLGFGREHIERHYRKTGQCVYLHLKRHMIEVRLVASQLTTLAVLWSPLLLCVSSDIDQFLNNRHKDVQIWAGYQIQLLGSPLIL